MFVKIWFRLIFSYFTHDEHFQAFALHAPSHHTSDASVDHSPHTSDSVASSLFSFATFPDDLLQGVLSIVPERAVFGIFWYLFDAAGRLPLHIRCCPLAMPF